MALNDYCPVEPGREFSGNYRRTNGFNMHEFHLHDSYEIKLHLSGTVVSILNHYETLIKPGDILIIPPGIPHRFFTPGQNEPYERICLFVHQTFFNSMEYGTFQMQKIINTKEALYMHLEGDDFLFLFNRLKDIINLSESNDDLDIFIARSALCAWLAYLFRIIQNMPKDQIIKHKNKLINDIIAYINDNYMDDSLTLDSIAKQFYISKYTLIHLFKRYTAITPHQWIIKKRIYSSLKLMEDGLALKDIAFEVGFKQYSNFYKMFEREMGIAPYIYYKTISKRNSAASKDA